MFYTANRNDMNIHKITLLLVCLATICQVNAQHVLTKETSLWRSGDVVCKQQIEYLEPGGSGKDVVWDFRDVDICKKKYIVEYYSDSLLHLFKCEPTFMEQYEIKDDTLFRTRYETPVTSIVYNKPIPEMIFSMAYGHVYTTKFEGNGIYSHHNHLSTSGTVLLDADAYGIILFSEQDTLRNVLRVHTQTTSIIGIEKDSVITDSTKWIKNVEDTYRWYVQGYRYPLFETCNQALYGSLGNVRYKRTSFRTPPDILSQLNDSINKGIRRKGALHSSSANDGITYSVEMSDNKVTIKYSSASSSMIKAVISDSKGIIYRQKKHEDETGEGYSLSISLDGLRRGVYILYININGKEYSNTIRHNI